jgi:hypothetical protein
MNELNLKNKMRNSPTIPIFKAYETSLGINIIISKQIEVNGIKKIKFKRNVL